MKAFTSTTQSPTFPARKRPAPTKTMEIQPRYFSTKKKKRTAATLAKPTAIQTTNIKKSIIPEVCAVCLKSDDGDNHIR